MHLSEDKETFLEWINKTLDKHISPLYKRLEKMEEFNLDMTTKLNSKIEKLEVDIPHIVEDLSVMIKELEQRLFLHIMKQLAPKGEEGEPSILSKQLDKLDTLYPLGKEEQEATQTETVKSFKSNDYGKAWKEAEPREKWEGRKNEQ